jgi:hypothetical protein
MDGKLIVLVAALCAVACDEVTTTYKTVQDARADRLFERGWLPDILPPSARNIRITSDLDVNTSSGEFYFWVEDFPTFSQALSPYSGGPSRLAHLKRDVERLASKGYVAYEYPKDGSVWVFMCNIEKGFCEYRAW